MKIKTRNLTTKPKILRVCTGIDGRQFGHGDYYTPQHSACDKCMCNDGQPDRCVQLQCPKPSCKSYERVPGTCCKYKCTKEFVLTDKSTAAVVASLSIILVVILVAISLVWKKMKHKEKYGQRFQTISPSNSQQETDLDTLIQKNSIPNNLRTVNNQGICNQDLRGSPLQSPSSSEIFPRDNSSNNPLLSGEEDDRCKKGSPKSAIDDSSRHRKTSSAKLHQYCSSETSPSTNKTNYTSVSLVDKDNDDLPFDGKDLVAVVDNDVFTTTTTASTVSLHKMRRFEPPPPYTRRSDGSSDPIAFV